MLVEMSPGVSGGNVVKGTASSDGAANSTFVCDTGLLNITKFIAWAISGSSDNLTAVIIYAPDIIGNNVFSSATIQTGQVAQRPRASIGAAVTAYNGSITDISNGKVTIKNASVASNAFKGTVYWYAEGT